jgi:hypothetical protein
MLLCVMPPLPPQPAPRLRAPALPRHQRWAQRRQPRAAAREATLARHRPQLVPRLRCLLSSLAQQAAPLPPLTLTRWWALVSQPRRAQQQRSRATGLLVASRLPPLRPQQQPQIHMVRYYHH